MTTPPTTGKAVEGLQKRLAQFGYYRGPIDGSYGRGTGKAVARFQEDLGLPVTGNMDPVTWAYLAWVEEEPVTAQTLPPPEGEILLPPLADWEREERWKQDVLAPAIEELLAGRTSPQELAARAAVELK